MSMIIHFHVRIFFVINTIIHLASRIHITKQNLALTNDEVVVEIFLTNDGHKKNNNLFQHLTILKLF